VLFPVVRLIDAFNGPFGEIVAGLVAEGQSEPVVLQAFFDQWVSPRRNATIADMMAVYRRRGQFRRRPMNHRLNTSRAAGLGRNGLISCLLAIAFIVIVSAPAAMAKVQSFSADFRIREIKTDGATLHIRIGGRGPAVVLLHGFGDTGDMWAPLAAELSRDHTVVVPDLRGMGLSSHPDGGYDKKTQAADIRGVLRQLDIDHSAVVGHDIGTMVAYAYAARYPDKTDRLVVMDAPVPGIPPWDEIVRNPALWHFSFGGPDAERLVAGRERIYLDRFWNEFAGDPSKVDEATRVHYAELYARPGAMHSAFAQFLSIPQDALDNKKTMATKLAMPVLAIGGAKSFGAQEAVVMHNAATNVTEVVIPDSGHWLMEEQPAATVEAVRTFLNQR
jgi:pimeloyl-ACP methyl ester carboxylesterase